MKIDEETVRRLAELAQVPIEAERRGLIAEGLEQFQALSDSWADLALSFRFEDGNFSYVWQLHARGQLVGIAGQRPTAVTA